MSGFLLVLFLSPLLCHAQSAYQIGALPAINFNYKLKNNWSINFKVESRQSFQRGVFNLVDEPKYEYVLTDYSLLLAKKIGLSARIAGGYLLRLRGGKLVHRFIQQYSITRRFKGLRFAHRLVTDQTFSDVGATEYRLRYRLATEIPLNGRTADVKEFYVKINNEYLNSIESDIYDLEIRFVPLLGYTLTKNNRLELGVDYRLNSFVNGTTLHRFWVCANWYIAI